MKNNNNHHHHQHYYRQAQSDSSDQSVQKKLKIIPVPKIDAYSTLRKKCKRVIVNVSMTHYDIIEDVCESMNFKIQYSVSRGDWDILWTDHQIEPDTLIRMHSFQKISHYPGIHVLARKNLLGMSLMQMFKKYPENYNFFPKTFLLPTQYPELRSYFKTNIQKTLIVKPQADCQGKGIFLTQDLQDVQDGKHYVVQQYISKPYLIDGLKFDFRVYVLFCGVNPMRLYIYQQGLARFATERYLEPNRLNLNKKFIHLTNYAINKKNPKYIYNSNSNNMCIGHKRSLESIFNIMLKRGQNITLIKQKIDDIIIKTFLLGLPLINHQYRFCQPQDQNRNMCFHILGIDIMFNSNCQPYLLEINHTPSFATDTPLDYKIKFDLIQDTFTLLNITSNNKMQMLEKYKLIQKQKLINSNNNYSNSNSNNNNSNSNNNGTKRNLYQNNERKEKVKLAQDKRDEYQMKHLGKYRRIFPTNNIQLQKQYNSYIETADQCYFAQNNVLRIKIEKQKQSQTNSVSPTKKRSFCNSSRFSSKVSNNNNNSNYNNRNNNNKVISNRINNNELKNKIIIKENNDQLIQQKKLKKIDKFRSSNFVKQKLEKYTHYIQKDQPIIYPINDGNSNNNNNNNKKKIQSQWNDKFMNEVNIISRTNMISSLPKIQCKIESNIDPLQSMGSFEIHQKRQYINFCKKKVIQNKQMIAQEKQQQKQHCKLNYRNKTKSDQFGLFIVPKILELEKQSMSSSVNG